MAHNPSFIDLPQLYSVYFLYFLFYFLNLFWYLLFAHFSFIFVLINSFSLFSTFIFQLINLFIYSFWGHLFISFYLFIHLSSNSLLQYLFSQSLVFRWSRILFLCLHLGTSSDLLFRSLFCSWKANMVIWGGFKGKNCSISNCFCKRKLFFLLSWLILLCFVLISWGPKCVLKLLHWVRLFFYCKMMSAVCFSSISRGLLLHLYIYIYIYMYCFLSFL